MSQLLKDRIEEVKQITKWNNSQIAKFVGISPAAVGQWCGQGNRTIHSIADVEVALKLEQATGLSAIWIAKGVGPKLASHRATSDYWPFKAIDEEKFRKLSDAEKDRFEGALMLMAVQLGFDVIKAR